MMELVSDFLFLPSDGSFAPMKRNFGSEKSGCALPSSSQKSNHSSWKVQFQYYFAEIMRQRAAAVGEYLPIEEINSTQNKDARIQSLQPFVKNGYIKFSKKHKTLLKQMTEYPMGKNDDAPDGLQMAVKLALDVKIGRRVDYRSVIARALDFRRGAY